MNIPLAKPDISEADIEAVVEVLRTPQLSLGPKLAEFEQVFCRFTGARYASAVSSGTAALHLAVKALEIGPGDEVITTPFSFVASANCILFEGARPVFIDIDPVTLNLDTERIESAITEKTKALLPVHVFGRPANLNAVTHIARKHRLKVVEDACEALGATWRGGPVGTWGDAGTFAFYPNKQMTTGEGGMLVTSDPDLERLFKSLRNQGRDAANGWLQHERMGFNYRISDISCALGISQLQRLPNFLSRRQQVAEVYRRYLSDIDEIQLPVYEMENAQISWFVYVIRLKNSTREERDDFLHYLRSHGVACNNYFVPIHLQPYFQRMGYKRGNFPMAEAAGDSTVALPFFNALSEEEIQYISNVIRQGLLRTASMRKHATVHIDTNSGVRM